MARGREETLSPKTREPQRKETTMVVPDHTAWAMERPRSLMAARERMEAGVHSAAPATPHHVNTNGLYARTSHDERKIAREKYSWNTTYHPLSPVSWVWVWGVGSGWGVGGVAY